MHAGWDANSVAHLVPATSSSHYCDATGGGPPPRKNMQVLVKQGSKRSGLVVVQVLLDAGAAYGAFTAGAVE